MRQDIHEILARLESRAIDPADKAVIKDFSQRLHKMRFVDKNLFCPLALRIGDKRVLQLGWRGNDRGEITRQMYDDYLSSNDSLKNHGWCIEVFEGGLAFVKDVV